MITTLIDVKGFGKYQYVHYVYTGENDLRKFNHFQSYNARINNLEELKEYQEKLDKFVEWVKNDVGVAEANLHLIMG